jgi:hypothetical protein
MMMMIRTVRAQNDTITSSCVTAAAGFSTIPPLLNDIPQNRLLLGRRYRIFCTTNGIIMVSDSYTYDCVVYSGGKPYYHDMDMIFNDTAPTPMFHSEYHYYNYPACFPSSCADDILSDAFELLYYPRLIQYFASERFLQCGIYVSNGIQPIYVTDDTYGEIDDNKR